MNSKTTNNSHYFVYILLCANGAYYTGITKNIEKRFHVHRTKRGAKFTKSFSPLRIEAVWEISGGRSDAQKVEYYIRAGGRSFKEKIIRVPSLLEIAIYNDLSVRVKTVQHITLNNESKGSRKHFYMLYP